MRKSALILTALLTVLAVGTVSRLPGGKLPEDEQPLSEYAVSAYVADVARIEEPSVPYGPQVEVIDAPANAPKATDPTFTYTGSTIDFQYYNTGGGTFKLRVASGGKSSTMSVYPDNAIHKIPLIYGNGEYTLSLFEQLSNGQARTITTQTLKCGGTSSSAAPSPTRAPAAAGTGDSGKQNGGSNSSDAAASSGSWNIDTSNPYLTPVVDINWNENLASVKKARELCKDKSTDKAKAVAVYDYLVTRLKYDYDLVGKLPSGYTPSMDSTYSSKKGICYDFASLYAGMMRSVGVECKLVTGYNTLVDGYHAWNEVKVDGAWKRVDLTIDCQLYGYGSKYGFDSPQGSVTIKKSY